MALENNATKITHTHDGTGLNGPKLNASLTHENVDLTSVSAIHHEIGTGPGDVAAGVHDHPEYLDKYTEQVITSGKKTFPVGAIDAPAIIDFQNSRHSHKSAVTGGYAAVPVSQGISIQETIANLGIRKIDLTEPFLFPADVEINGLVIVNFRASGSGSPQVHSSVSYGPSSVAYGDSENVTQLGFSDVLGHAGRFIPFQGTQGTVTVPFHIPTSKSNSRVKLYMVDKSTGSINWVVRANIQFYPVSLVPGGYTGWMSQFS